MANRVLSVPSRHLHEAVVVIEAGLAVLDDAISEEAFLLLKAWCESEGGAAFGLPGARILQ